MAKKFETSKLEAWQRDDAKRLLDLWNRQPAGPARLSQSEFAERYGFGTQGNLSHYLHGRRPLNLKAVGAFAKGLGVEIAEISPRLALELADIQAAQAPVAVVAEPVAPYMERQHIALLQAYLSLAPEIRFSLRMLIESLAGAKNPRMAKFMAEIEAFNHKRAAKVKP